MDVERIQSFLKTSIYQSNTTKGLKLPAKNILKDEPDLFGTIDEYLNLSHRKLDNFYKIIKSSKSKNTQTILNSINKLIKHGIVGYEYLDVKNQPYKSFISTRLISPYSKYSKYTKTKIYRNPLKLP